MLSVIKQSSSTRGGQNSSYLLQKNKIFNQNKQEEEEEIIASLSKQEENMTIKIQYLLTDESSLRRNKHGSDPEQLKSLPLNVVLREI